MKKRRRTDRYSAPSLFRHFVNMLINKQLTQPSFLFFLFFGFVIQF